MDSLWSTAVERRPLLVHRGVNKNKLGPVFGLRKPWTIPKVFDFDPREKYLNTKMSYSGFDSIYHTIIASSIGKDEF